MFVKTHRDFSSASISLRSVCFSSFGESFAHASFSPSSIIFAQPKICTLKIHRPETDEILSRFWCEGCSKALCLAKTTSQKMPKFHRIRRIWITHFWLQYISKTPISAGLTPLILLARPIFSGRIFSSFWRASILKP